MVKNITIEIGDYDDGALQAIWSELFDIWLCKSHCKGDSPHDALLNSNLNFFVIWTMFVCLSVGGEWKPIEENTIDRK